MRPYYRFPVLGLLSFTLSLLLARRRSFVADGLWIMRSNRYPRRIEGLENVPRAGPFILVMNHYNREGLRPYICAFLLSAAIARIRKDQPALAWVFAAEVEELRFGPVFVPRRVMPWLFRRIADIYGFIPMPRRWHSTSERAAALLRISRVLTQRPVGLTPEGGGEGTLQPLPSGVGLFLASLSRPACPLLPVGIYEEEDNTLVLRFGKPFTVPIDRAKPRREQDAEAGTAIMAAIGRLLPPRYHGAYAEAIATGQASTP